MSKCRFCPNEKDHEKGKHCKSCNLAFMTGRQEALTKAKGLVREVQLQSWEQERERIIKLLEQDPDAHHYALRLIKGENK